MTAGLNAAKKSLSGMGSQLKSSIKMAATFGGALAVGSFIKDAIKLESRLKALSFTTEIMTGEARDWKILQSEIQTAAVNTSRTTDEMTGAFERVLDATKDLEFTSKVLETIGYHATGADRSVEDVASVVQMLQRQLKVTAEEIPNVLASIDELSRQGGPSFQELAADGDTLAAIMQQAGLQGAEGFKLMLGILNEADATMAGTSKKMTGLQVSLQKLRDVAVLKRMAKELRIPEKDILAAENSFEAMKLILSAGEKGLMRFKEEFKGPEAAKIAKVYSAPFIKAYREARKAGVVEKKAVERGLAALDDAFKRWAATSLTESSIKERAASRAEDADAAFRSAIDEIRQAFADPKLQKAVKDLAAHLPALAEGIAKLVTFMVEHPLLAAGAGIGAKVVLPAAGAAVGTAASAAIKKVLPGAAKVAAVGAPAAAAAIPGAAIPTAAVGAGALAVGGAVVAGGAVGGAIGYGGYKAMIEPALEARLEGLRSVDEMLLTADELARTKAISPEALRKAIEVLRSAQTAGGPTGFASYMAHTAKFYGSDIESAEKQHADRLIKLGEAEMKLMRKVELLESSMFAASVTAGRFKQSIPEPGTGRGPMTPANKKPGAYQIE